MIHNSNTHRDINTPEGNPERALKIVQPENVVASLETVGNAIEHDQPVTQKMMNKMHDAFQQMMVTVGGEEMTIARAQSIPNAKENIRIWREIMDGNNTNIQKMTALTDGVARTLAGYRPHYLRLNSLTHITEEQAKILAIFEGAIELNGLTHITDDQASALAGSHGTEISLSGLKQMTDTQMKAFANFKGIILLNGLEEITDGQAAIMSNFLARAIGLGGLKRITDTSAERLVPIRNNIDCSSHINMRLHEAALHLGLS